MRLYQLPNNMQKGRREFDLIHKAIVFLEGAELQAEETRLSLNHQIMFTLPDTYLSISKQQTSLSLPLLARFLNLPDSHPPLQRMIKWNNHGNSLNLSFAEFSAMLVSKEDRLLAKMVLQREEMGAIPNFLLDQVRQILMKELEIHEYCMKCEFQEETLKQWIESIIDENGDICHAALDQFMAQPQSSNSSRREAHLSASSVFMRYLQTSGNITGQRLLALFEPQTSNNLHQTTSKLHKLSTYITMSPKSLLSCHSQQQLIRPEYFDCLNRPPPIQKDQRKGKSIQKHIYRVNSQRNLKIIAKGESINARLNKNAITIMNTIQQIIQVEKKTQNCKIDLRLCPDFYPILFYDSLPKDRTKKVTSNLFRDYLQSFGYYVQPLETYLFFRRYAPNGKITFNSFCSIFDTVQSQFDLLEKNRYVETLQDVEVTTKRLYFAVLLTAIRNQAKINSIKTNFLKQGKDLIPTVDRIFQIFGSVDGQLSQQQFKEALRNYLGISVSLSDIKLVFRRCIQNKADIQNISKESLMGQLLPVPSRK